MKTNEAYNIWAETYDTVFNKTRDLELLAQQQLLKKHAWETCLELGCGTGKNTAWLATKSQQIWAVDFNDAMMSEAQVKISLPHITFIKADIQQKWKFLNEKVDLISCSLVLEHIKNLAFIFEEAFTHLHDEGLFYIGELHPFKQYFGSQARFETEKGTIMVEQFTHHFSDYSSCAKKAGFNILEVAEFFHDADNINEKPIPRILAFVFKKNTVGN